MHIRRALVILSFFGLMACQGEEPVAEKGARTEAEIMNLARELEAEAANDVAAAEARLENEADLILESQSNAADEAANMSGNNLAE